MCILCFTRFTNDGSLEIEEIPIHVEMAHHALDIHRRRQ